MKIPPLLRIRVTALVMMRILIVKTEIIKALLRIIKVVVVI